MLGVGEAPSMNSKRPTTLQDKYPLWYKDNAVTPPPPAQPTRTQKPAAGAGSKSIPKVRLKTHSVSAGGEVPERSAVIIPALPVEKGAASRGEDSSRSRSDSRPVSEAKHGEKVEQFLQKVSGRHRDVKYYFSLPTVLFY